MIVLPKISLDPKTSTELDQYQAEVNAEPDFDSRINKAESSFDGKSSARAKPGNPPTTFEKVREALDGMSSACHYCERGTGHQIEHIYPKVHYPERCFSWDNYCYVCSICNTKKSSDFALWSPTGRSSELGRQRRTSPPPDWPTLFINPRTENPLDLLFLDILSGNFHFRPLQKSSPEKEKAEYTINLLGLNTRADLVRKRKEAYNDLQLYIRKGDHNRTAIKIKEMDHQGVWQQMKKQYRQNPGLFDELHALFTQIPEALDW